MNEAECCTAMTQAVAAVTVAAGVIAMAVSGQTGVH